MKNRLRDKSRDRLAEQLNALGVQAEMKDRGQPEEKVSSFWIFKRSLGVIDVKSESIKLINVLKKDGSNKSPPCWWFAFLIPCDLPIPRESILKIKTVRKKSFPVFGKVLDVHWKGDDRYTGLIAVLSRDVEVDSFVAKVGDLSIRSHKKHFQGWAIESKRFEPTQDDWIALGKIAKKLVYISS
jgi:hypothetical protein